MALSESKNVDVKALAMPLVPVAAIVGVIVIFAKWGVAGALIFWFAFVIALLVWGLQQGRRARREIRSQLERSGCKVVKISYRYLRLGPFSIWNSSRTQHVYRVVAQEPTGRERIVWARWGRRWYWNPDTLELRWDGEASPR